MILCTESGNPLDKAIEGLVKILKYRLDFQSAKPIAQGSTDAIRAHFQFVYPGSSHYSPRKVKIANGVSGNVGVTDVNVPGVSRAYHDIDIYPTKRQSLTIPLHQEAFGKKATDFENLFVVNTDRGKAFLARNNGGSLEMMYLLTKHVHQKQNKSIMPTDDTIANGQFSRLTRLINDIVDKGIAAI